ILCQRRHCEVDDCQVEESDEVAAGQRAQSEPLSSADRWGWGISCHVFSLFIGSVSACEVSLLAVVASSSNDCGGLVGSFDPSQVVDVLDVWRASGYLVTIDAMWMSPMMR